MESPGEALLRKCINPLWYFQQKLQSTVGSSSEIPLHGSETSTAFGVCRFFNCASGLLLPPPNPLSLGFGGVREGRGGCGCCGSLRRRNEAQSAPFPRRGQQICLPPFAERPHRGFSAASLESVASFVRARDVGTKKLGRVTGDRQKICPMPTASGKSFY